MSSAIVRCKDLGPFLNQGTYRKFLIKWGEKIALAKEVTQARQDLTHKKQELKAALGAMRIAIEANLLNALKRFMEAKRETANPQPSILGMMFGVPLHLAAAQTKLSAKVDIQGIANLLRRIFSLRKQEKALDEEVAQVSKGLSSEAKRAFSGAVRELHPDSSRDSQATDTTLIADLVQAKDEGDATTINGIATMVTRTKETDIDHEVGILKAYLGKLEREKDEILAQARQVNPLSNLEENAKRREAAKGALKEELSATSAFLSDLEREVQDGEIVTGVRNFLLTQGIKI